MNLKKAFPIIAMLMVVFLAGCNKKDDITGVLPEVTSTNPISDATNIAIGRPISAVFSVAMNSSTISTTSFTLMNGTSPVAGTVTYTGYTATFAPTAILNTATTYTGKITAAAANAAGLGLAKDYTWSFTTGGVPDVTRPTVASTDPSNSAVGVLLNKAIVVTFSKAMDATTVTSLTYSLNEGTNSVAGTVTNTTTTAKFTPTGGLAYGKTYTGKITTGVKDLAGNTLLADYTFSFTTLAAPDTELPRVNATDPLNNAILVTVNKVLTLTFSEAMTASTILSSFTLKQGPSTPVLGTVAYTTGLIATFTPTNPLAAGTTYTAAISTGAKDLAGNALAAKTEWSFTTIPQVTLLSNPVEGGTTSGADLFNNADSSVIITATPNSGYTFTSWSGDTTSFTNPLKVKMNTKNKVITANFAKTYTLTITASNGVVVRDPVQSTYNDGSVVQLTATPNSGYTFTSWGGDAAAAGSTNPLTVTMTANKVITANFTLIISGATPVNLGLAGNYVIFANTAIANPNANSTITGDIGVGPGYTSTAITGFSLNLDATGLYSTSSQVVGGGKVYAHDYAPPTPDNVNTASNDMLTAYNDAAGRAPDFTELHAGDLSGQTLAPGVYKWSNSVLINTDVTLSGSATDVWIFEIAGDLTIASGASIPSGIKVVLSGGALASNVYWQVGGLTGATLNTYSTFNGIILSAKQIVIMTGAVLNGKALAQTQVTLDANSVQP